MSAAVRVNEDVLLHSIVREGGHTEPIWIARVSRRLWESYRAIHRTGSGDGHLGRLALKSAFKVRSRYSWLIVDAIIVVLGGCPCPARENTTAPHH